MAIPVVVIVVMLLYTMRLLVIAVVVACSARAPADQPAAGPSVDSTRRRDAASAVPDVTTVATDDAPTLEPVVLDLVEGTPATLVDGTEVNVKGVMYAHLADSKNLSSVNLIVTRAGATQQIALSREHGGAANDPDATAPALGWQFTLEMADPYQRPSRARVEARKLP